MGQEERKERLILVGTLFFVGIILYTAISLPIYFSGKISGAGCFLTALLGGWLLGGILSGIFMFASFVKEKSLFYKIVMCIFFSITVTVILGVGILGFFPYMGYNLYKLRR